MPLGRTRFAGLSEPTLRDLVQKLRRSPGLTRKTQRSARQSRPSPAPCQPPGLPCPRPHRRSAQAGPAPGLDSRPARNKIPLGRREPSTQEAANPVEKRECTRRAGTTSPDWEAITLGGSRQLAAASRTHTWDGVIFRFMALPLRIPMFSLDRDPIPRQFRNWCRPKRLAFSWFSPKENHTSRSLSAHSNCETALVPIPNRTPCLFRHPIPIPALRLPTPAPVY